MHWYRPRPATARALIAGALLAVAAHGAGAQDAQQAPPLARGTRVRVTAAPLGADPQVARVLGQRGDTLAVRPEATQDSVALPVGQIARLEVSGGRHTRMLKGIGVGVVTGAVGGAVLGALAPPDCGPSQCAFFRPTRAGDAILGALGFGVLGAVAGGIAGAVWRSERWDPVHTAGRSAQLRIWPERRGGVALAVAF